MLDGRFDPALAALFVGDDSVHRARPFWGLVLGAGGVAVALAGLLGWSLL